MERRIAGVVMAVLVVVAVLSVPSSVDGRSAGCGDDWLIVGACIAKNYHLVLFAKA